MQTALENPGIISLAAGFVDQQSLPVEVSARSAVGHVRRSRRGAPVAPVRDDDRSSRLRARLIERLERTEGVAAGTYQEAIGRTVVTTGSAQLIYLVCEALLDPGDIVLVESPTYFVFLGPVETRGARAIRVPIDEEGLRIDALERTLLQLQDGGAARPGQAHLHDPRTCQSDRDQPGGPAAARPGGAGKRWSIAANRRIFLLEDAAYHGLSYGSRSLRASGAWIRTGRR